jgi:serine/threonine-protein kinase RsbW
VATIELEIPAKSAYVGIVRLALAFAARSAGLGDEAVDDLKIAVSEACANAVLSHEAAGADAPVTITWNDSEEEVVIEVADRGSSERPPADDSLGGAGRFELSAALLQSLLDECTFEPRPGGGTRARLVLRRR